MAVALLAAASSGARIPERASDGPSPSTMVLSSCSESSFRQAVLAGGVVTFATDCPDLVLTRSIAIKAGLVVDIEAGGHTVALDGANAVRHFVVSGGSLSITGVTLENGRMTSADAPAASDGDSGTAGADGSGGQDGRRGDAWTEPMSVGREALAIPVARAIRGPPGRPQRARTAGRSTSVPGA